MPPRQAARINVSAEDNLALIERKCLKRDYYPLSKGMLNGYVKELPPEYLVGLNRIELMDRNSRNIGDPYGFYRESEKVIIMYSVPPKRWVFGSLGHTSRDRFRTHGASVGEIESGIEVTWKKPIDLAYFMFAEVFLHELGHHYIHQYRHRNKSPGSDRLHEELADIHMRKLAKNAIFCDIWRENYKSPCA